MKHHLKLRLQGGGWLRGFAEWSEEEPPNFRMDASVIDVSQSKAWTFWADGARVRDMQEVSPHDSLADLLAKAFKQGTAGSEFEFALEDTVRRF